ncbi:peptidase T [Sporolactobacillus spathodeae]|uniref:Peptidase T n=1 Tax=Sporolactobacillus spathodeae TaxID=1465502 RepID=A0ABS2Q7D3_9BACL|nr:peptidase T [Sporolactobacillus spathodeae]MBM7656892.1 tripeptide aminopeptidase [Sporolactobacillus spathodeae]
MKEDLIKRFISYVKINTQSSDENSGCPSTPAQLNLLNQLVNELKAIGMSDVTIDANGYVMATLPATLDQDVPTLGFMAHVDTATDFTGDGVNPQFVENYDGGDILLNKEKNVVLSPSVFPDLKKYKGQTLITTDGTTLLGADDKAGVAEIMTAMDYLIHHPEVAHGRIRVAFTPDEEIGRGPHKFDVKAFDAALAYTIDGGALGGLEYENFNAAEAKLTFQGSNVHPGSAKGKMVNSIKLAIDFQNQIPSEEAPELTEGYEGFYHLLSFVGDAEQTKLNYIIRDFDKAKFEAKKKYVTELAQKLQEKYGKDAVLLDLHDQYYNMKEKVEEHQEVVAIAYKAMKNLGIEPQVLPIRGGTDGAQISFMGLPTPNLFAGGENFHGKYEYVSVQTMVKAAETIVEISRLFAEQN